MKKELITILLLSMVIVGISITSAESFEKNISPIQGNNFYGWNMSQMQEIQNSIQQSIKDNDYDSWKTLMKKQISLMESQITEDNFNKFVNMQNKSFEIKVFKRDGRMVPIPTENLVKKSEYAHCLSFRITRTICMAISSGEWINILGTFCIFMPALLIKELMVNPG